MKVYIVTDLGGNSAIVGIAASISGAFRCSETGTKTQRGPVIRFSSPDEVDVEAAAPPVVVVDVGLGVLGIINQVGLRCDGKKTAHGSFDFSGLNAKAAVNRTQSRRFVRFVAVCPKLRP